MRKIKSIMIKRLLLLLILFLNYQYLKASTNQNDSLKMLIDLIHSMPEARVGRLIKTYELEIDKVTREVKLNRRDHDPEESERDDVHYIVRFKLTDIDPKFIIVKPIQNDQKFVIKFFTIKLSV